MKRLKLISLSFVALVMARYSTAQDISLVDSADIPYLKGQSKIAFHPKPEGLKDNNEWFTNDHSFIEDKDGTLHWFGINNPFPPKGKELYRYHPYLGHLSTTDPKGKWTRHPHAIDESKGTEYVGAPYVIWHDESKRYAMVVETRLENTRRLEVCWSTNLMEWKRTHKAILPDKLWISTRDPHIIKGEDGKYWIHVVTRPTSVIRIKTKDFETFENPQTILTINDIKWATLIESPFIIQHKKVWYLMFTYAHKRYTETVVVVSKDPNHFDYESNTITTLFGHASKVFTYKGRSYISSCGPEDGQFNSHALTLAELKWAKQ